MSIVVHEEGEFVVHLTWEVWRQDAPMNSRAWWWCDAGHALYITHGAPRHWREHLADGRPMAIRHTMACL